MHKAATFFILFFLVNVSGRTQQVNYVHYDTKDGLAGSTVYGVTQDKDGFLWFATDFGVSRFDGKRFKNFTTDDGLPDNEVLNISADHSGRVWVMPFNGQFCYYFRGKFYTEQNDSLVKKISALGTMGTIMDWSDTQIYLSFQDSSRSHLLDRNNNLHLYWDSREAKTKFNATYVTSPLSQRKFNNIITSILDDNIVKYDSAGKTVNFYKKLPEQLKKYQHWFLSAPYIDSLRGVEYKGLYNYISEYPFMPDSLVAIINTKQGSLPVYWNGKLGAAFLPGKNVSKSMRDREGNLWFTTLGEGVYKLTSSSMKTYAAEKEFFSISGYGTELFAGDNSGVLHHIDASGKDQEELFTRYSDNGNQRRLYCMKVLPDGTVFLGFDCFLLKYKNGNTTFSPVRPIKSIDYLDEQHIVVSTNYNTFIFRTSDLAVTDTIFRERATKILYRNGKSYIGSLHGLMVVDANKNQQNLGNRFPILSNRIVDMCWAPDGGLFIATNDKGVVKYSNDTIMEQFHLANGLSSNICRSLFCDGRALWVGTNKGLNKINLETGKVEAQYTMANGLPSDIINAVSVQRSTVWVGTPGGLTFFKEQDIVNNSICNLVMERIIVSGFSVDTGNNLNLNWRQNNISFEFSGISMKAAGDIIYRYRLNGLDDEWKETKLNTLIYPSLPSGNYRLEIYAVNKFGQQSGIITINFSIARPFWKTTLFWVFMVLALAGITILLLNRRYRQNLRRRDEKNRVAREISEARQQALQAQMNPHFVFNCLNSIQQFIMLNEKEKANKYLTEFADLIRKTLENSDKKNITVAEEIAYLRQYLEMEQLRYGDAFDFNININEGLQADFTEIPAMLLQPYIENSLRHGIRHKTNGKGRIELLFLQENNLLTCVVKDNGIGRAAAQKMKSAQHIEYQSKGMALTARRIELLNTQANAGIKVLVNDVLDDAGTVAGTQVTIHIPLK